jgi:hypothetical protein
VLRWRHFSIQIHTGLEACVELTSARSKIRASGVAHYPNTAQVEPANQRGVSGIAGVLLSQLVEGETLIRSSHFDSERCLMAHALHALLRCETRRGRVTEEWD